MTLYEMIRSDEGEKLNVYKDTEGFYTVGIGHLLTKVNSLSVAVQVLDKELSRKTNGTITKQESQDIFNRDVQGALRAIKGSTLSRTYDSLDKARQDALVNMVFQLGLQGVLNFKNMIKALDRKDFIQAAKESLDSRWARQTPNRARRVSEVIRTGTFNSY